MNEEAKNTAANADKSNVRTYRCNNCGETVYKHQVFCTKCGEKIDQKMFKD